MTSSLPVLSRVSLGVPSPLKSNMYPAKLVALLAVIIVPYLHIGVFYLKFWVPDKQPVNKEECRCSCFDTVFKGSYESPGNSRYKHIYFNATQNTFKIWAVTVVFIFMFYESLKRLLVLGHKKQLHGSWLFLFLANIYPNYYSWWMLFGYYNDEFYRYLPHQIYFCITELVVTGLVLSLCNKQAEPQLWKILLVIAVSFVHVFVASLDQFVTNVLLGQGRSFQNSRDVGLMIPDLLHLVVAAYWYFYHTGVCSCRSHSNQNHNHNNDNTHSLNYNHHYTTRGNGKDDHHPLLSSSWLSFSPNTVSYCTRKRDLLFLTCVVLFLVSVSHVL